MDAVEVRALQNEVFKQSSLVYVYCIDRGVRLHNKAANLPHLGYSMVMGHISFPNELQNRRIVLFPDSEEKLAQFRGGLSPVIICVKASCIVQFMGEEQESRVLIYDWELMINISSTAVALKPRTNRDVLNSISLLPWLNFEVTTCNCNKFPQSGFVLITSKDGDFKLSSDEGSEEESLCEPTTISADDTTQYAENIKLKGCSYHGDFQVALKKCQHLIRDKREISLKLNIEPVNVKDENAIVVQAFLDDKWKPLGYVPGRKIPKVLAAMEADIITNVKLVRIYRDFIMSDGAYCYFADVVITKFGRWDSDSRSYAYNDPVSMKYNL